MPPVPGFGFWARPAVPGPDPGPAPTPALCPGKICARKRIYTERRSSCPHFAGQLLNLGRLADHGHRERIRGCLVHFLSSANSRVPEDWRWHRQPLSDCRRGAPTGLLPAALQSPIPAAALSGLGAGFGFDMAEGGEGTAVAGSCEGTAPAGSSVVTGSSVWAWRRALQRRPKAQPETSRQASKSTTARDLCASMLPSSPNRWLLMDDLHIAPGVCRYPCLQEREPSPRSSAQSSLVTGVLA